jgi:hypothetical protein
VPAASAVIAEPAMSERRVMIGMAGSSCLAAKGMAQRHGFTIAACRAVMPDRVARR